MASMRSSLSSRLSHLLHHRRISATRSCHHQSSSSFPGGTPESRRKIIEFHYKMTSGLDDDGFREEAVNQFLYFPHPTCVATCNIMHFADKGPDIFLMMYQEYLNAGLKPNAYTYTVVIKELAKFKKAAEAKKILLEMVEKGMRPNAATCVAVLEGLVSDGQAEEGEQLLSKMREKGFMPEEKVVRKVLKDRNGPMVESVLHLLFGK